MIRKLSVKTLVIAGVLVAVSAGVAAAGGLPGAAQDTATAALERVGITVSGANDHSGDHPNTRGSSGAESVTTEQANANTTLPAQADEIVAIATDSSISGLDKGQAVSSVASDGRSRAGAEHATSATEAGPPASVPVGPPADIPAGPPADVPAGPPADLPTGPPTETPAGPPADVPAGPPADVPAGPPADVPPGPPADLPAGPPVETPAGPPASLPVTPPERP
jgi:hypothetical protein